MSQDLPQLTGRRVEAEAPFRHPKVLFASFSFCWGSFVQLCQILKHVLACCSFFQFSFVSFSFPYFFTVFFSFLLFCLYGFYSFPSEFVVSSVGFELIVCGVPVVRFPKRTKCIRFLYVCSFLSILLVFVWIPSASGRIPMGFL